MTRTHGLPGTDVPRLDPGALDPAFAIAARQVADGTAPFVILAVAGAGGLVRMEAHAGPGTGIFPGSICLLASVSKPVTASAVVRLVEDGHLALTDRVDRFLPEFGSSGKPEVTIWHLLTHTSGVPDFELDALLLGATTRAELIRRAAEAPLLFAPGTRYEYASSTFSLLGAIVEVIAGQPWEAFLRGAILEPLGMRDTSFDPWERSPDRVAPLALATPPGSPRPWAQIVLPDADRRAFTDLALPGAGLFGTVDDLVRFGRAMLRGGELDGARVLAPESVALMTREQTNGGDGPADRPPLPEHYALGWAKPDPLTSPASPAAFSHRGVTGTHLWVDPAHDLVVVHLTGVWGYPSQENDRVVQAIYAALG